MARVYREGDIGDEITTRKVAILGYGSQGHAHALNLKESGCDVTVGLYDGSKSWPKAEDDGLQVKTIADAVRDADVVMMLLPDEKQPAVFQAEVGPNLTEGDLMLFAHGFNIHFNQIVVPPDVDLGLVAPKGPGHVLRRLYVEGKGMPSLFAVENDASGQARDAILSYARAIGSGRAGIIETSFAEETETDLFGEQAVLCGGLTALAEGRVRYARRGRLPAGARLLRVRERAEADRRPHLRGWAGRDAVFDLEHRRVRRLHGRAENHRRGREREDARHPL